LVVGERWCGGQDFLDVIGNLRFSELTPTLFDLIGVVPVCDTEIVSRFERT
jgi:hypothetical protein